MNSQFCNNLQFGIVQGRLIQSPPGKLQWFPQDYWESEFFLAQALGISYIELIAERNHNDRNPIWSDDGINRIEQLCQLTGLINHAFCNDYIVDHMLPGNKDVLDQNLKLIKQGAKLGMRKYILPLFEHSELNENNFKDYLSPLRDIASCARDNGILVCLETILNAEHLIKLLSELDHGNIKVVFDTGNRVAFGHDIPGDIRKLGSAIQHIHLKDKNDANQNVILGTGKVNFCDVFAALHDIDYQGPYTFETNRGTKPIDTAKFNIYLARFFAREIRHREC